MLHKFCLMYVIERGEEIKVTAYYDGMELIERYDPSIDLIFLDIQMRLMDGLQAAELSKPSAAIFFCTQSRRT